MAYGRETRTCPRCGTTFECQKSMKKVHCSKSCGCRSSRNRRHGLSDTPIHRVWSDMKYRCELPTNQAYPRYGGRGITVCERWQTFENFLEDMGDKPPGMSIDRIDNDKGYEPSNCRWATDLEQSRNRSVCYTPEQDQIIRDEYAKRTPLDDIAKLIGRPKSSICLRAKRLGVRMYRWPSSLANTPKDT